MAADPSLTRRVAMTDHLNLDTVLEACPSEGDRAREVESFRMIGVGGSYAWL